MTNRENPYSREFLERHGPGSGQGPDFTPGQGGTDTGMQRPSEQMQQKAGQFATQAKDQTKSFFDSQRERIADGLGSAASALRQTSGQLYQQDRGTAAQYTHRAADTMERASSYLRDTNTDEMLNAAERYARREPALFLGGALALGFLGARFLKSSRRHDGVQTGRLPTAYRGGQPGAGFTGSSDFIRNPQRPEEAS